MKQITLDTVERAIHKVDNLNDESLERLAETYALAQPTLLGYVMAAAEEYQNEKLEGYFIYYFCLFLESFNQQQIRLDEITEEKIEAFEDSFFEVLGAYFDEDNEDALMDFCDQPELVRFMMVEVSTDDVDGSSIDDETATQLFIAAVAMIALLTRAIAE